MSLSSPLHPKSPIFTSKPFHFFIPDTDACPQLDGLKPDADDKFILIFDIETVPIPDVPKHPIVSVFITDAFIGEEVQTEKKHHQAYTPMREKKPRVVYKRKYRKVEDRIQLITTQLPEEF
jgi:hypothetical protein